MKLLLAFVFCLSACASSVSDAWKPDPTLAMTPQALMAAKTCTDLPVDHTPNINAPGWTKVTGSTCGGRYASGMYRCDNPASCQPLVFAPSNPADPADRGKTWHILVDGVGGSFGACAEPANRFGWSHSIDCTPIEFSGVVRAVLPVVVPKLAEGNTQTSTTVHVTIYPRGPGPVTIGQIGPAEIPTEATPASH